MAGPATVASKRCHSSWISSGYPVLASVSSSRPSVTSSKHRSGLRAERDEALPDEHVRDIRASHGLAERLRHGLQAADPLSGVLERATARTQPVERAALAVEHDRHRSAAIRNATSANAPSPSNEKPWCGETKK